MTAPNSQGREHGTSACYAWGPEPGAGKGCRCEPCKAARKAYDKRLKQRAEPGYVDATEAREHVADLMAHGIGLKRISALTGLSGGVLCKLMYGTRTQGRGPSKRIRPATRDALLAVKRTDHADAGLVDARPTWKVIDQLLADGWTKTAIARRLGQTSSGLQLSRDQIQARHARTIAALLDEPVPARRSRWGDREAAQIDRAGERREKLRKAAQAEERADYRRRAKIREALERGEDPYGLPDLFRAAGEWMRHGPCRQPDVPTWLFFPPANDTQVIARAKAVCATCPVQTQCAAAGSGQEGIWGGLTEAERSPLVAAS